VGDGRASRRAEVIGRWLGAVEESVAESSAGARVSSGDTEVLRVDAHLAAADCPAGHLGPSEEYRDSARNAARELALETLRRNPPRGAGARRDPLAEVSATLGETTVFRPGLASWFEEIDRAERSAVVAAAVSWMVDALALAARHGEPLWHIPSHRARKLVSAPVTIAVRVDASRETRAGNHLLVLAPGPRRTDQRLARRIALVSAAAHGEVPVEVHIGHRDTLGRYRHGIDDEQLELGVEELTDDIRWRLSPSDAPRLPGRSCTWCALADVCPEGSAHLDATRGSPVPPWLVPTAAAQESSAEGAEPTM